MTITESLISSFILVALSTQSSYVFSSSMQALGKGRMRDQVNAIINQDIERVRQVIASWEADTSMTTNGQLSYWPSKIHCDEGTLGTALLSDNATTLLPSYNLNLSQIKTPLKGLEVAVNVGTAVENTNLIQITYTTNDSKKLNTKVSTTLSIPAQGWCPT